MIDTARFQFLSDALRGTGGFSNGGELVRYPREDDIKFARRRSVAWFPNPMMRACSRFVGYLSKRPPVRDVQNPLLQAFVDDCNWRGDSLDVFWSGFMLEAKARGCMLLLVDMPSTIPQDQTAQLDERAFPYLVTIPPESVTEYVTNERGLLESVSYASTDIIDGVEVAVVRTWDATQWSVLLDGDVIQSGEHGLGVCPVLIFSESGTFPSDGQFSPIADMGKRLYNMLSELDELLRAQTFSILAYHIPAENMAGFDAAKVAETIGTHNMLVHTGEAPQFISPTAIPTEAYFKAIDRINEMIDAVGLNVEPPGQAESGIAMKLRFQALNSALTSFARRMEDLERRVFGVVALWLGLSETASTSWAKDYSIADLATELATYQQMLAINAPQSYLTEKMKELVALSMPSAEADTLDAIMADVENVNHERAP